MKPAGVAEMSSITRIGKKKTILCAQTWILGGPGYTKGIPAPQRCFVGPGGGRGGGVRGLPGSAQPLEPDTKELPLEAQQALCSVVVRAALGGQHWPFRKPLLKYPHDQV